MADVMPDADAVSPVIESTLSVSIMGRGRRGWFLLAIHTPQRPSDPPLPFHVALYLLLLLIKRAHPTVTIFYVSDLPMQCLN